MHFLLQKENGDIDMDVRIVKEKLDSIKYVHSYSYLSMDEFFGYDLDPETGEILGRPLKTKDEFFIDFAEYIPIGTIEFVTTWLKIFHGISNINPIEVPECLRINAYLKRKYSIVKADEIPREGEYFIKDASQLKVFSYCGEMKYFLNDDMFEKASKSDMSLHLDPTHLYQVSEAVNILSEYRVYIIDGKIEAVVNYNGDPCIFPDIDTIQRANMFYSTQKDYPKSYSMDIMVTRRGTSIIEVHPFLSIGLYTTLFGDNLLYAYRDGIDYVINHNTNPVLFNNFPKPYPPYTLNKYGCNDKIKGHVLADEEMLRLGFDKTDNRWHKFHMLKINGKTSSISFNFNVFVDSDEADIYVLDDDYGQPYDYQRILRDNPEHEFAKKVRDEVESFMKFYEERGILTGHVIGEYI